MIGILGGTFDPIHYGHLKPAEDLLQRLPFEEIRFMPSSVPPHRPQPQASPEQRLAMVSLAIEGVKGFSLEACEVARPGPSYMVESLAHIRQEIGPDQSLVLIMGTDAFLGLPGWHLWQSLTDNASILVTRRPDYVLAPGPELERWLSERRAMPEQLAASTGGYVAMIEQELVDISSTRIRSMIREHQDVGGLLPYPVYDYIYKQGLYLAPEIEE